MEQSMTEGFGHREVRSSALCVGGVVKDVGSDRADHHIVFQDAAMLCQIFSGVTASGVVWTALYSNSLTYEKSNEGRLCMVDIEAGGGGVGDC